MAKNITFDFKVINLSIEKTIEAKTLPIARQIAVDKFNNSLNTFVNDLDNDPVSMEIKAADSIKTSRFIGGQGSRKYGANLFTFIGFEEGSDPIGDLLSLVKNSFKINRNSKLINGKYSFKVTFPSESLLKAENPFPEGFNGRSWITGIEKGISNVINYIRKSGFGRSGGGVQIKGEVNKTFKPKRDYFSTKYRKFVKDIQS